MQVRSLGQEDALEKEKATHSSALAWEVLQIGAWWALVHEAVRVGHNLGTKPQKQRDIGPELGEQFKCYCVQVRCENGLDCQYHGTERQNEWEKY